MTRYVPVMLTINQAAERLNLPKHFIRSLCLEEKIIYTKAGNKYLINFGKLIDFPNH